MSEELTQAILELVAAEEINHPRDIREARKDIASVIAARWESRQSGNGTSLTEDAVTAILMTSPVPGLTGAIIQRHASRIARLSRRYSQAVEDQPREARPRGRPPKNGAAQKGEPQQPVLNSEVEPTVKGLEAVSGAAVREVDSGAPVNRKELTAEMIDELKNKGYNQSEIARMYGVTRQAVSWHKRNYGGRLTPREAILEQHFPWKVSQEQSRCSAFRRLRDHAEYMATGGVGMSDDKLRRLRSFYRTLRDDDVVLEYDPHIPPRKGFAKQGGFALRSRHPRDRDLMIRVNRYTNLTKEGRKIWRLPPP